MESPAVPAEDADTGLWSDVQATRHDEIEFEPGDGDRAATGDAQSQVDLVVWEGAVFFELQHAADRVEGGQ
jgi:pantothenate kinase-related protein Tda10